MDNMNTNANANANAAETVEFEMDTSLGNKVKIVERGSVEKLPKIKKAIIGHAEQNCYGKQDGRKVMVTKKFQILVILGEDWKGLKKGEKTTANRILSKAGVKTFSVFSDWNKAKKACESVKKWGKEVVKAPKAKKQSEKDKALADAQAEVEALKAKMAEMLMMKAVA